MTNSNSLNKLYKLVYNFLKKDKNKTRLWFYTKNPLIGDIKPIEMIQAGRIGKLLNCVQSCLEGNYP